MTKIIHIGGEHQVTGSCHLLQANGLNILVDCGLAQGGDKLEPVKNWPIAAKDIDYLFLTHAHIDHIGRVPELLQNGFSGEIITTHPTKALLEPMLEDAMGFSDLDQHEKARLLKSIDDFSWGFEYDQKFDLQKGISFQLGRAGHILGSCFIHIDTGIKSIVFSGDLGAKNTPILPDPDIPGACDLLILESTYGDRLHADRTQRIEQLGHILTKALSDQGKVFIPAFALGRTQELIYEIDRLFSDSCLKEKFPNLNPENKIPVFIDTPLGLKITDIYAGMVKYWDQEARQILRHGDHPLDFEHLYTVKQHREHLKLHEISGPAIIIAGSGMCTGGRIINHLKTGLNDSVNDVLFVGYQAKGTLGRNILRYARQAGGYVVLDRETIPIKAGVYNLSGYSAHADQQDLVDWVQVIPEKSLKIKLVHGERSAQQVLGKVLLKKGHHIVT